MNQLRTAYTPPAPNRWKVADDTGDECREYEEVAEYYDQESEAYAAYEAIVAGGGAARLYSTFDDGEEADEWELEEFTGDDLADPRNVPCRTCQATNRYLHVGGECTACYPVTPRSPPA